MIVNLVYFAQIAEILGFNSEEFDIPDSMGSVALVEKLKVKYPELVKMSFAVAVNQVVAQDNVDLEPGFEIALLPPFAGG